MNSLQKLIAANNKNKFVCVGLDTDLKKLPQSILSEPNPILSFNSRIIEATKDYASAYKLNFAFYESEGIVGLKNLEQTLKLIPSHILTIGDAKRGDIGNTSQMYAKAVFNNFGFDCITLHPYMGYDSLSPFFEYDNKLNFVLTLTSNPGADDIEKLKLRNDQYLYQKIIELVNRWNDKNNCGIVFGATKIQELNNNLSIIKNLPVLLPGVGAQGGKFEDVINSFNSAGRKNYLINISRGILYKDSSDKFDRYANSEILDLNLSAEKILS